MKESIIAAIRQAIDEGETEPLTRAVIAVLRASDYGHSVEETLSLLISAAIRNITPDRANVPFPEAIAGAVLNGMFLGPPGGIHRRANRCQHPERWGKHDRGSVPWYDAGGSGRVAAFPVASRCLGRGRHRDQGACRRGSRSRCQGRERPNAACFVQPLRKTLRPLTR